MSQANMSDVSVKVSGVHEVRIHSIFLVLLKLLMISVDSVWPPVSLTVYTCIDNEAELYVGMYFFSSIDSCNKDVLFAN